MGIYYNRKTRRAMLKQLGTGLALPMLYSLLPPGVEKALASGALKPNKNFIGCFFPLGAHQEIREKKIEIYEVRHRGNFWDYPHILKGFKDNFASESLIVQGASTGAWAHGGSATFLTGYPWKSSSTYKNMGPSIDQLIKEGNRDNSLLGGVVLGWENGLTAQGGLPKVFDTVSWANSTTAISSIKSPVTLFDFLFKRDHNFQELSASKTELLRYAQKSVLDNVVEDIKKVQRTVSSNDKQVLERYLTKVRELEKGTADLTVEEQRVCNTPSRPSASSGNSLANMEAHWRKMQAITAEAFSCGLIHTATMTYTAAVMFGEKSRHIKADVSYRLSHGDGSSSNDASWHGIGHRSNFTSPAYDHLYPAHNAFTGRYAGLFQEMAQKMKDKNLLNETTMLLGSGCSNGNHHTGNVPMLLVTGNSAVKSGAIGNRVQPKNWNHFLADMLVLHGIAPTNFGPSNRRGLPNNWGTFV